MIAGFCFYAKTLFWSPNRIKKVRIPVSHFRIYITHQHRRTTLIFNLFNG